MLSFGTREFLEGAKSLYRALIKGDSESWRVTRRVHRE